MSRPVKLVPLLPYDGKTGLMIPFVLERVRKMASERAQEMDPDTAVRNLGARIYGSDPSLVLMAFIDDAGKLVGHIVASIETDGTNHWVFVSQVKMDAGDWGDAVVRAMEEGDQWAQWYSETYLVPNGRKPVEKMLMATHRDDKAWQKKFGFESHRMVMMRDVGTKQGE